MSEQEKRLCVVCKQPVEANIGFVTEHGPICSTVCLDYIAEQAKKGNLNESNDLNEVQLL